MIKISNLSLPVGYDDKAVKQKAAKALGIAPDEILELALSRVSIDARKKTDVHHVCALTLSTERDEALVELANNKNVVLFAPLTYEFPVVNRRSNLRPVVVGMGPAGLFAALQLARAGLAPIVLERGRAVEQRSQDVSDFWKTGVLSEASNVQFGEGGAGTFSDGKLSTGINDPRISHVFETFVGHGAPRDIIWSQKPHIGTDVLRGVVKSIREEIISLGGEVRFENTLESLEISGEKLSKIAVSTKDGTYEQACDCLVLAVGHSARDTFAMLLEAGLPMEQKPFAIGVRIEHNQGDISRNQFGCFADRLPPADYKLACHLPNGRSAFSFCVCPGGQVIAAASEQGRLVTNGMSLRARAENNVNGGFLVGVKPTDFGDTHPLSGLRFREMWESRAFKLGGGNFRAPVQLVSDFLGNRPSKSLGSIAPSYQPGVTPSDMRGCLPAFITDTLAGALPIFDRSLRGFANPDAVMTGVETRSSSPVRIVRGENMQSKVAGIYPCGEGAGYAGGITSAAVDGIRVAEAIAADL